MIWIAGEQEFLARIQEREILEQERKIRVLEAAEARQRELELRKERLKAAEMIQTLRLVAEDDLEVF